MNIQFGVDYYPEHWPVQRWETDAKLMQAMGVQVVRMAEFSWFKMEPEEGKFNFAWLDQAIELLASYGIKSVLGTPTAAAPAWIIERNPEIQPTDPQGRRRHFGGRHHNCQSNEVYRAHVKRFVNAFAEHFAPNPNVIGWQVGNELGNSHNELCMCESCEKRFREWLEKKYGTIEELNRRWGTDFWSQGYQNFAQIQAPKLTVTGVNPSQMLDWKRFHSDLIVEYHQFQSKILRHYAPDKWITQNMMGFAETVDYFELGKDLEFSSHDQYPSMNMVREKPQYLGSEGAGQLDIIRGTKEQTFWIMEQQTTLNGWYEVSRRPRPGQIHLWAMQSVAHGADTIVFFRWRSCAFGTEQYWEGVIPHSGIPGRVYDEIKGFMHKNGTLMQEIKGLMPQSEAAIVFSYDQEYAIDIQPHHPDMKYVDHLMTYYRALYRQNIPVDLISDQSDFSRYKLLVAPLQYMMDPVLEEKYRTYVKNGGTLVLTMRTGVKDRDNICDSERPLPGGLADVVGLKVYDYDCLRQLQVKVAWDGKEYICDKWCDVITPDTAEAVACYASEYYKGTPAITVNVYGDGKAYYVGTEMTPDLADRFITEVGAELSLGETPDGVEITRRMGADKAYYFVLNHNGKEQMVNIPEGWQSYYEGQTMPMPAYGVYVYTEKVGK
ncbi:MAG: beta-galactosidase [Firmicutes bacterium]|nr:beta-galactosidase [Bacillota bacterium]